MSIYFTYILYSERKSRYYIGSCEDIENRLRVHNSGSVKVTKYGIPWKIVYKESFNTRSEAFKRELQVKKYKGGCAFKKLIES